MIECASRRYRRHLYRGDRDVLWIDSKSRGTGIANPVFGMKKGGSLRIRDTWMSRVHHDAASTVSINCIRLRSLSRVLSNSQDVAGSAQHVQLASISRSIQSSDPLKSIPAARALSLVISLSVISSHRFRGKKKKKKNCFRPLARGKVISVRGRGGAALNIENSAKDSISALYIHSLRATLAIMGSDARRVRKQGKPRNRNRCNRKSRTASKTNARLRAVQSAQSR